MQMVKIDKPGKILADNPPADEFCPIFVLFQYANNYFCLFGGGVRRMNLKPFALVVTGTAEISIWR